MSSSKITLNDPDNFEFQKGRHSSVINAVSNASTGNEEIDTIQNQEAMELYSRARAQHNEIVQLREQVAIASIRELQLLNEKYALERTFSELRMALDERQNEAITSASNELARRKGDLEENLKLTHELKIAEDEKYIFISSMLGLLGEYGIWPHVVNASTLSSCIKSLHDQLQLKIRTSHSRIEEMNMMGGIRAEDGSLHKDNKGFSFLDGQLLSRSTVQVAIRGSFWFLHLNFTFLLKFTVVFPKCILNNSYLQQVQPGISLNNYYTDQTHLTPKNDAVPKHNDPTQVENLIATHLDPIHRSNGKVFSPYIGYSLDVSGLNMRPEEIPNHNFGRTPVSHDQAASFPSDDGPGIEGFQITGDAKPGGALLGCGFPVRGTSLCMFQWVRHLPDGTRQYIEGATNPEYFVTADDVDKLIAVECIPMDDQGRQGELVRLFANDQNKITCDPEMQLEIDTYISKGLAQFSVLLLMDFAENWEETSLILRRSEYKIVDNKTKAVLDAAKYSKELSIKIPGGLSGQFVLTNADGASFPFSTYNDARRRDTLVLTMRMLQSKALDEKRKTKA